jgi:hypothetical protein
MRLQVLLAVFFPGFFAFSLLHSPAELVAAVTVLATAVVAVLLVSNPPQRKASPAWARSLSLRERAHRAAFLRLRDPDAAGRPRRRAPGCGSTSA